MMRKGLHRSVVRAVAVVCTMSLVLAGTGSCGKKDKEESSSAVETLETDTEAETTETESVTEPSTEETSPVETTATGRGSYKVDEGYEECWQIVKATTNVNVRTGASSSYDTIGLLKQGDQIQRYSIDPSWSQVVYHNQTFYIATQYLEVVSEDTDLQADPVLDTTNATITIADDGSVPQTTATETDSTVAPETTTAAPAETTAPTASTTTVKSYTWDELLNLDNTTIPFGTSVNDVDEYNIPNGVYYYRNLYSQYGADFIAPNTNTIYLTMDEGYEAGYTPEILDTLKAKNVKAVFFVTKQFVTENPDLVRRMIDEGHVIGNHTCAHPSDGMPSLGAEAEMEDIMWLHNYVQENFGYTMTLFRFPTGAFSIQSLALLNYLGYRPVFWSYAHNDWDTSNQPDEATALQNTLNALHPGAIYLLHAVSSTNTHNMADFIDGARAQGYEFGVYPSTGF